jgi:hypothetical protein
MVMKLQEKPQPGDGLSPGASEEKPDAMLLFYLFRLRACHPATPEAWIEGIIRDRPSAEIDEGEVWRIGNIDAVDGEGLMFVVGRGPDHESGDFDDVEDPNAPCTYALYDSEQGILSMALKPALSPSIREIVDNLRKLLNRHAGTDSDEVRIEIDAIIDPDGFIDHIMSADVVTEFTMQFDEHNCDSGDTSMRKMLEATGGRSVQTTILGDDLDREALERLARSAATAGYDVSIRLCEAMGQSPIVRRMQGDPIDFLVKGEDIPNQAKTILNMARQIFSHIAGNQTG